ncbi:MAG TPA: ATP-binding protein [bacterium]|nr:ATP-binding protein [bacterium]
MNRIVLKKVIKEALDRSLYPGVDREITKKILLFIERDEIISLSGVRRSGKTTVFHQLISHIGKPQNSLLINFEDERLSEFSVNDFDLLIEIFYELTGAEGRIFMFFDEIQEVSSWEKWVRRMYDEKKNIKIFVTGSSSALLSSEFSTLLTGRTISFVLYPFSFQEYLSFVTKESFSAEKCDKETAARAAVKNHLGSYITDGGFPAVSGNFSVEILQQYFQDIIYRDIVRRYQIRDVRLIEELYRYLFANISNPYSFNALKNTFKTGLDTIREYLSYGISAHLFYEHTFFSYSLKESFNRPRKVYGIDTGLRKAVSFTFSQDTGRMVENLVYLALRRSSDSLYYFTEKNEIDFVLKNNDDSLSLFNVCYSDDIPERELKGIENFSKRSGKKISGQYIISDSVEDEYGSIKIIPLWKWLLTTDRV